MTQLNRGLGLTAGIAINVANVIGTGVFLKTRVMTCNVDDPMIVMAVWFAAGLLSLLDVMMGLPIGEALAPLHLPQPAIRALVNGDGPWHPMLDLVRRLEQRDMQAATELAELYGGLEEVSAMAEAAWRMARLATSGAS